MADLDTLRIRGIPFRALVDGAGVAVSGTDTIRDLADEGMAPICEVDETGVGVVGSETAATLRNRGIPVFCEVLETGLSGSGHTLPQLRDRGIPGYCIVGLDGIAQSGTLTIAQLRERGIASFCPVDEDGVETGLGTARITLTGQIVAENTANGTTVGTLATVNTTGTAAFTLVDTAGGRFSLTGNLLKVANSTLLNYEVNQFHSIVVSVSGVTPTIANRTFLIAVTNVLEVTLAALTLDDNSVVSDDVAGTVVGAILGKTSGSELSLTDSDGGRYAISGTNLVVGSTALVAGTDSVTIRETHGDATNTPRDTILSITVTAPLLAAPEALVLTWISDPDDNTPVIDAAGFIEEGDTIRFQFDTVNTFNSGSLVTSTNTVDAAEDAAEALSFTIGTLADGTWYSRARIERPLHENSAWSNIVSETIVTAVAVTWNPADKHSDITLSSGNLVADNDNAAAGYRSWRGTTSHSSGKWFIKAVATQIGFASGFGFADSGHTLDSYIGSTNYGVAYVDGGGGLIFQNSGSIIGTIGGWSNGDIICMALDLDNDRVWFRKNNTGNWNNDGSANPATNTNGIDVSASTSNPVFFAAHGWANSGPVHSMMLDTSSTGMPSGFSVW